MSPEPNPWEPRWPRAIAALACTLAALTLLWPLLTGQILFGGARSDMFIAGYSFRLFGAEEFKATGSIPQWNPFLFGGLPFIAAMHGDIFYPTAWLRLLFPVDLAITWGMAVHFVLAGWLTYGFARALRLSWTSAVVAGVCYELSGIVASQMSPGHDGKLFVSALTPLAFWVLLRGFRDRQAWAFGAFAIVVALLVLGHYQMCYFLLIALGLWCLYLAFLDPDRPQGRNPWIPLGFTAIAVVVGIGITALQVLPFLEYVKYSPRATGGPNTGWDYVNLYSMPPEEIFTVILPQFNGVLDNYWGRNPIKFHTEYLGIVPLLLAGFSWGNRDRRRLVIALLSLAAIFLLFAFAGHTPFYRPFYELLPMLKKLRAMGMVFFLVAFPMAILAGIGLDRLLSGQVARRSVLLVAGGFGVFALLGLIGVLQAVAEGMAVAERMGQVQANAGALRLGSLRLLVGVVACGAVLWGIAAGKLRGGAAPAVLVAVTAIDLWSIDRLFYQFSPRAAQLFGSDEVTTYLQKQPLPFRVLDAQESYGHSILMAYRIPDALGYHGNELRAYDELGGKDQGWRNLFTPNVAELLALRYVILRQPQEVPGFHQVVGPVSSAFGTPATLYERDTVPPYARVVPSAAKVPEPQLVPTVVDPRFPGASVVLYPDTASLTPDPLVQPFPVSQVKADVARWAPGKMTINLTGSDSKPSYLLVAENWYPDWHAIVDGKPAPVLPGDNTLLSVALPSGARQVDLTFDSPTYRKGKLVSLVALLAAVAMAGVPAFTGRKPARD